MFDVTAILEELLATITIPFGAEDGTPRSYTAPGSEMPAGLIAYYAAGPWDGNPDVIDVGTLFYGADTTPNDGYIWSVALTNVMGWGSSPIYAVGRRDPFSVDEYQEIYRILGSSIDFHPGSIMSLRGGVPGSFFGSWKESFFADSLGLFGPTTVEAGAGFEVDEDSAWTFEGREGPRAIVSWTAASTDGTACTTTEAIVLNGESFTCRDNRAYEFSFGAAIEAAAAPAVATVRIRRASLTGMAIGRFRFPITVASQWCEGHMVGTNTTGSDFAFDPQVCLARLAGAGTVQMQGFTALPRYVMVKDVGHADDFPTAAPLTNT